MSEPRPLVKRANDPDQVRRAGRRVVSTKERERNDLLAVMLTPEGRAFIWRLLRDLRVYESVWHPSALIHYNAGRQDAGHELMAHLVEANEDLFDLLMREARVRAKRSDAETDAGHIAPAGGDD